MILEGRVALFFISYASIKVFLRDGNCGGPSHWDNQLLRDLAEEAQVDQDIPCHFCNFVENAVHVDHVL